ncbi:MAG: hypothetical protein LC731_01890, partial [Acidobacteria bacterium]|nr:hypothetical protein [Acidobacteriota bacterium]
MKGEALWQHFRERTEPAFLPGFRLAASEIASEQSRLFPTETKRLIREAALITDEHRWPVLGFGEKQFGDEIEWRRDPLSGYEWPL